MEKYNHIDGAISFIVVGNQIKNKKKNWVRGKCRKNHNIYSK